MVWKMLSKVLQIVKLRFFVVFYQTNWYVAFITNLESVMRMVLWMFLLLMYILHYCNNDWVWAKKLLSSIEESTIRMINREEAHIWFVTD